MCRADRRRMKRAMFGTGPRGAGSLLNRAMFLSMASENCSLLATENCTLLRRAAARVTARRRRRPGVQQILMLPRAEAVAADVDDVAVVQQAVDERHAAHLFFQLVSRRYERGSIMVTSNRSVGEWGEVFGDAVVATAILDRLLDHSHVLTITC